MNPTPGIVTVGLANTDFLTRTFFWRLERAVPVYPRASPELVSDTLKAWRHPLCIVEHKTPHWPAVSEIFTWLHWPDVKMPSKIDKAYELLPEWIECSPDTRYIITLHERGTGVGKERKFYERFPQVISVIGFLDTTSGHNLLYREIKRLWGISKKPPGEYELAYEHMCQAERDRTESIRREYEKQKQLRASDDA